MATEREQMKGPTGKPRLVLLHGLGGSAQDWAELTRALHRSPASVAIDLPGSAQGPKPRDGYDPASLARWLFAEIEKREIPWPVVLGGHSLGARVAGEAAALEPGKIAALALVSPIGTTGYGLGDTLKWKGMSRQAVLKSVSETTLRNALSYGFSRSGAGKTGFVERGLAARTGPDGPAVTRALEKEVDGFLSAPPLTERLKGTKMPLVVVSGAEDPLAPPEEAGSLRRARPDATFCRLAGLGHYPMLEDPKAVAKVFQELLTRL